MSNKQEIKSEFLPVLSTKWWWKIWNFHGRLCEREISHLIRKFNWKIPLCSGLPSLTLSQTSFRHVFWGHILNKHFCYWKAPPRWKIKLFMFFATLDKVSGCCFLFELFFIARCSTYTVATCKPQPASSLAPVCWNIALTNRVFCHHKPRSRLGARRKPRNLHTEMKTFTLVAPPPRA